MVILAAFRVAVVGKQCDIVASDATRYGIDVDLVSVACFTLEKGGLATKG